MSASTQGRRGVACAGNWIVDHVKIIDAWPAEGNLANILRQERGTGGAPFNVLIDLARLDPDLPLEAHGLTGADADGQWIRSLIEPLSSIAGLRASTAAPTSYTDVMTVEKTGGSTLFHMQGANAVLDVDDVDLSASTAKIFHLGYLLLMKTLDGPDPDYGTRAARLLARAQEAGLLTSIDVVSAEAGLFQEVVIPALKHVDICVINEVEVGEITGLRVRTSDDNPDWTRLEEAARKVAAMGVARNVTIHLPEGAVALDVASGEAIRVPSLELPAGFIKGAAGAGDAFCAGMLYGLHEGWPLPDCMELAHGCAVATLRHPTCTDGMTTLPQVRDLITQLRQG